MKIKARSKKQLKNNLRFQALLILDKIEHQDGYSNVILNEFLSESPLSHKDNQLVVQIVYGVIQQRYRLNYYLEPFIEGKKIDPWIMTLLRMSIYQMTALDRIPSHAIINEAVKIAKTNGHQGLGNFVNAILRSVQREGIQDTDQITDPQTFLATHYSIEPWIVDYLIEMVGYDKTESILASLLERPIVTARINPVLTTRDDAMQQLSEEGFDVTTGNLSPFAIRCQQNNPIHSTLFTEGKITIQDESSMLVAPLGQLTGTERVLDACSAPGGKATHIASYLSDGHLDALDISADKLEKVAEHAQRMQLDEIIDVQQADASTFEATPGQYDAIYVDAPCSGLGLMRRKPEIKYTKTPEDLTALKDIQLAILNNLAPYLKENGVLIYSTCTITMEENENLLKAFMSEQTDFINKPIHADEIKESNSITDEGYVRIWPDDYGTDGFFIARLEKKAR